MSTPEERRHHGNLRHELHRGQRTSRPLSKDHEAVGLAGEDAFAEFAGIASDRSLRPHGSNSINFTINGKTVNVYTARIPNNLLVERGKVKADYYVLAAYREARQDAFLIGWATKEELLSREPADVGGKGVISHAIPAHMLHHMDSFMRTIKPAPKQPTLF